MTKSIQHRDIRSIGIRPAMNGRVRVEVDRDSPFPEIVQTVPAVTVYGDGRVDFHDDASGMTPAVAVWHRELVRAARDLRSPGDCLYEGRSCIAHDWHEEGRCPQARLADILAALDDLEQTK